MLSLVDATRWLSRFGHNISYDEMFLKMKHFLNVSYKFWFTLSPKNGYLECTQFFLSFFLQISSKLKLFSCRDGVYSLSMILSVCFDVKKPLGLKHL